MVRETYSSLPGIGLALTMTVSPGWISTKRWSRFAIRARPAIGSPWAPGVAITRLASGGGLILFLGAVRGGAFGAPCAPVVAITSLASGWSLILSLGTIRDGSYVR